MNRPSSPRSSAFISAAPQASIAGRRLVAIQSSTAAVFVHPVSQARSPDTSCRASVSMRSTVSPDVRHAAVPMPARTSGRGPENSSARSRVSGSKVPSPRSRANARCSEASCGPLSERGSRAIDTSRSSHCARAGTRPRMCSPSRICISLRSHRCASSARRASWVGVSFATPMSASSCCARASDRMSSAITPARFGSRSAASAYSSTSVSSRARSSCSSARVIGGVKWSIMTAPARRLAWIPSPGSLTMKG